MDEDENVLNVEIRADTSGFRRELEAANSYGQSFARSLTSAFTGIAIKGRSVTDTFRGLALQLSQLALKAAFKPIENAFASTISGLFAGVTPFASGGVVRNTLPVPFAKGGVVSQPATFPLAGGRIGLMGERGAEAIMPLARGPDGRLGVRADGGGGGISVTLNVSTPDAESFRRSETQIASMLTRVVAQGQRNL